MSAEVTRPGGAMRPSRWRLVVVVLGALCAARSGADDGSAVNLFSAVDSEYYLALVLCGWLTAYSKVRGLGGGRDLRFFLLYRAPLTATTVCDSAARVLRASPAGAAAWRGCAAVAHAASDPGCRVAAASATNATVTAIALEATPPDLADIFALTAAGGDARRCGRPGLVNLFNLAPDVVDVFLRPRGVRRVAVLDADAWPARNFLEFYDARATPRNVVALARHAGTCPWTEKWAYGDPLVRATLGADHRAANQRRFKASVLLVKDLARYCERGVARAIAAILRRHNAAPLWKCGVQQPPLVLALANDTELLGSGLALVGRANPACDPASPYVDPRVASDGCKQTAATLGHDRSDALARVLDAIAAGDADACLCRKTGGTGP